MRLASQTIARPAPKAEYVPGEVILRLKDPGPSLRGDLYSEYGADVVERFHLNSSGPEIQKASDIVRLKLPTDLPVEKALDQLQKDDRVEFAEPNYRFKLSDFRKGEETELPNDLTPRLWGLHNEGQDGGQAGADISAKEAWAITQGDSSPNGPLIAVIDTGIDYTHPDLADNMWTNPGEIPNDGIDNDGNGVVDDVYGFNAFDQNGDPMDGHSHGTHCAGTIGAVGNNGQGVVGVSPEARLMAVKIFSDKGESTSASVLRGLLYANKMGADITSNSWGGGPPSEAVKEAFASSQALHVVAAGNDKMDNDTVDHYPANYEVENMIVVAATDRRDRRASFSQWGATKVDLSAPGKDIWSTVPRGSYASYSGTSMATPHVSGVAALIASAHPEADATEIKDRLIYGSDLVSQLTDISVSDGRVNAASSLEDDLLSPGVPQQVKVDRVSYRGTSLSWLTPPEDGEQGGKASKVEVRMSPIPITEENFRETSPFLSSQGQVRQRQHFTVLQEPSLQEREVYLSVQAVDNVGNRSPLVSTSKVTIPAARLLLEESFGGQRTSFQSEGSFRSRKDSEKGRVFTSAPPRGGKAETNSFLTSPRLDLRNQQDPFLSFDMNADLAVANSAELEITTDGRRWKRLERLENSDGWSHQGVDLSDYQGKTVQLRFSVHSRIGRAKNGISLANLKVYGQSDNSSP
jgi:subtilisin family serine protease